MAVTYGRAKRGAGGRVRARSGEAPPPSGPVPGVHRRGASSGRIAGVRPRGASSGRISGKMKADKGWRRRSGAAIRQRRAPRQHGPSPGSRARPPRPAACQAPDMYCSYPVAKAHVRCVRRPVGGGLATGGDENNCPYDQNFGTASPPACLILRVFLATCRLSQPFATIAAVETGKAKPCSQSQRRGSGFDLTRVPPASHQSVN